MVELINKLQQLGLLGDDLLHTINGREYVTPEHLRKEVIEAVDQAGGRIALVSAANAMRVHLAACMWGPGVCSLSAVSCSASDVLLLWAGCPRGLRIHSWCSGKPEGHEWGFNLQVDLPAALEVDLVHCERQAAVAVEQSGGRLQRIQGDLITGSYFDNLALEINEILQALP